MKIALLTDAIFPNVIGGIQKHSYSLIRYLVKQNCDVDIYHSKINRDLDLKKYFTVEELIKINFIDFIYPKCISFPGHYIYSSFKLSKLYYNKLRSENYNLIYAQGFTCWYTLKKEPFKSNLVSNLHGLNMFQNKVNFKEYLKHCLLKIPARYIIKKSSKQISLGGKLSDILKSHGAKQESIVVIPNAIEQDWLESNNLCSNSDKLKFVFIGRYDRVKGIEELTDVLNELIFINNFEFHFVGPIPDSKKINHKNIIYHGLIKDQNTIRSILINSDILVSPSYSEGMPTVILEAMSCGNAIIATNVGANCTMVNDSNGWLIDNYHIKKSIKKAIIEAISTPKDRLLDMKNKSFDIVIMNYTWEKVIHKYLNLKI